MKIIEGKMPFKGHETYYRIVNPAGSKTPLLLLHGGPGSTHNYLEVLDPLAELDDRPLVMYDQIGCGLSMVTGQPELFTAQVWKEELMALRDYLKLDQVHILGQSWGGMLQQIYQIEEQPTGVKSYIFSSTLSSAKLWREEGMRRVNLMPAVHRQAILKAEESGNYQSSDYLEALNVFMERYCCGPVTEDSPACLKREKSAGSEAYMVGWGPNEFTPTGTLSGFEYTDHLREIAQPSLVISGAMDLSSPYIAKTMYDNLPNAEWELFQYSRHMCYIDETEKYINVLIDWLNRKD
ncbi:proline iminopeptidase [Facklamia miroungae]|uniref:Proline iminopeptidase n=1 Tax=Facklamia miroungae TaxID=120956 RepID=A0A1G7U1R7_9LACT|nr:proline iminopeptidase-family hydrolase [Facklamia miroungae]NKZ29864.1 proline iminopeptidase-family hydrolase [Facklamia miroungae]SDG41261.1 proline iminopeptidase [Facklamia miroungae]